MRSTYLFVLATLLLALPAVGAEEKKCKAYGDLQRCERLVKSIHNVTFSDRTGDIVRQELNLTDAQRDSEDFVIQTGLAMVLMVPSSTHELRLGTVMNLIANAKAGANDKIRMGRYDWTSSKTGNGLFIAATRIDATPNQAKKSPVPKAKSSQPK
jgi:hypothetical protein